MTAIFLGSILPKIRYLPKLEKGNPIFSNSDAFLEKLTANLGGRVAWSNEALLAALDIQAARASPAAIMGKRRETPPTRSGFQGLVDNSFLDGCSAKLRRVVEAFKTTFSDVKAYLSHHSFHKTM